MFCEKCGNEVKDTDNVCSKCGASLIIEDTNKINTGKHIEGKFDIRYEIFIILPLLCILLYLLFTVFMKFLSNLDNNIYNLSFLNNIMKAFTIIAFVLGAGFIIMGKQYIVIEGDRIKCKGSMMLSGEISCDISEIKLIENPTLGLPIPGRLGIGTGKKGKIQVVLIGLTNKQDIVEYLKERIKKA